jgi:hypothetical protein
MVHATTHLVHQFPNLTLSMFFCGIVCKVLEGSVISSILQLVNKKLNVLFAVCLYFWYIHGNEKYEVRFSDAREREEVSLSLRVL